MIWPLLSILIFILAVSGLEIMVAFFHSLGELVRHATGHTAMYMDGGQLLYTGLCVVVFVLSTLLLTALDIPFV